MVKQFGSVIVCGLFHLHSVVKIQPFSPVFLLAEYRAKAFCRLSLWNFKEKSINHFLEHSLFFLREQALGRVVIFWLCSS